MSDLFIGLLSGTSMDAIDVALVSFAKTIPDLIDTYSHPIPKNFRKQCLDITQSGQCSIDEYGILDAEAGELFAEATQHLLNQSKMHPSQICAIGSHGQTLRHRPDSIPPFSLQIGDPNIIAERTGILTVADFRRRDIAAQGQGAPLAPAFHASVFQHTHEHRIIINIGGISNVTLLPKDKTQPIIGFDTGPGNGLMDAWIQKEKGVLFDVHGDFASSGQVHLSLLEQCLKDPYFKAPHPKSTGREYFNLEWLSQQINVIKPFITKIQPLASKDIQATLLALTVHSITLAILGSNIPDATIFVCGGGAQNRVLMQALNKVLNRSVRSTAAIGLPPDWIEAMLFAWLAKQTLEGRPGNCPTVTGATRAIPLGGIFGKALHQSSSVA
jgi:anhydro-N-acetylmuramic acid kinase